METASWLPDGPCVKRPGGCRLRALDRCRLQELGLQATSFLSVDKVASRRDRGFSKQPHIVVSHGRESGDRGWPPPRSYHIAFSGLQNTARFLCQVLTQAEGIKKGLHHRDLGIQRLSTAWHPHRNNTALRIVRLSPPAASHAHSKDTRDPPEPGRALRQAEWVEHVQLRAKIGNLGDQGGND